MTQFPRATQRTTPLARTRLTCRGRALLVDAPARAVVQLDVHAVVGGRGAERERALLHVEVHVRRGLDHEHCNVERETLT